MNQILKTKPTNKKAFLLVILCMIVVIMIILSFSFALANAGSEKIISKIKINGILVEGLTREEVKLLLQDSENKIINNSIDLTYEDYKVTVIGKDLGIKLNIDAAIDEAYNYGRRGNILVNNYAILFSSLKGKEITLASSIDEEKFNEILNDIKSNLSQIVLDDKYEIKDDTLVFTKGKQGVQIEKDQLKELIINGILKENSTIEIPTQAVDPVRISIDTLYSQIHKEPKSASYETVNGTFQVNKEENGLKFNKELAIQEYEKINDGESFEIDLEVTKPDISITDLNDELFKDVLGKYETKYDKYYTTRAENLRLAASKINGKILYPGEIFSYNEVVGERTAAAGYKMAHVFAGGRVINGLGGGICQVSTTLYNAVIYANLEIVERKAHQMHTGYVQPGRDATVVYGTIDFKFKNNRDLPIKIVCSVVDGVNKFEIYGIKKDTDPTVEFETKILNTVYPKTINENDETMDVGTTKVVQTPMNGYTSETYKILKNSAGEQISRTLLSKDIYQVTNKIVKVGTKPIVQPEPVVPEQEVPVENQPVVNPPAVEEPTLPPGWDSPESPYVQ